MSYFVACHVSVFPGFGQSSLKQWLPDDKLSCIIVKQRALGARNIADLHLYSHCNDTKLVEKLVKFLFNLNKKHLNMMENPSCIVTATNTHM